MAKKSDIFSLFYFEKKEGVNLMELFKILGTIAISGAEKAEKDTEKVSDASQKSAKKIGESFKTVENTYEAIGKTIVKMAKVGVAAIGTVSTVVGALTKSAVEN